MSLAENHFNHEINELDYAVRLSAAANRTDLTQRFGEILHKALHPCTVAIYGPENGRRIQAGREKGLSKIMVRNFLHGEEGMSIELGSIDGAIECAMLNTVVDIKTDNTKNRTLVPVLGRGGICDILVVEHRFNHIHEITAFVPMIRLFENLLHIFDHAERDSLTQLLNRKAFDKTLANLTRPQRTPPARSADSSMRYLALIDIDHFKSVNDLHGHLYGDEVLIGFAKLLENSFRRQDWIFRYGGEEFAVIIEEIDENNIEPALERFRGRIEQYEFPIAGTVTASIGCSKLSADEATPLTIDKADKALYYAKNNGRNRVARYESLVELGKLQPIASRDSDITLF
jgi:diguanylate cyclase (GGDEF)-like protein